MRVVMYISRGEHSLEGGQYCAATQTFFESTVLFWLRSTLRALETLYSAALLGFFSSFQLAFCEVFQFENFKRERQQLSGTAEQSGGGSRDYGWTR